MGCTCSKLNKDICLKDETTEMQVDFIKKNGLDAYFAIMGVENDKSHNSFDDNSSNVNLGLFNIETKNGTDTEIENSGLSIREYVKIAIAIIIALGAIRIIFRYLKKRRAKAAMKKKNNLKELVVSATGPTQGVYIKPLNQSLPIQKRIQNPPQEQKMDTQLVPINLQKDNQIVPINMARLPYFQTHNVTDNTRKR